MRIFPIPVIFGLTVFVSQFFLSIAMAEQQGDSTPQDSKQPLDEGDDEDTRTEKDSPPWNLSIKTAGGTQFWTDFLYRNGFRIQQNSLTGHWRLLDKADVRLAWGTKDQCRSVLDERQPVATNRTSDRHVVFLLHGLMRTRHSMTPLQTHLNKEGYDVIRFSYASSRSSIGNHAKALREVMEGLPANTRFSFVGHSMGNIVVRHMIGDLQRDGDSSGLLARCQSMVMMGPPNQGAAIARRLAPTGLYAIVTGKGGMELGPEWDEFVKKLAIPPFPFAIVAGDVSSNRLQNPLVDGSGDFVVSLDEARLEGCQSFETVPVLHSFLMSDPAAMKFVVDFMSSNADTQR